MPVDNLKFTSREPRVFTRKGSSGKDIHFNFCKDCGTNLCGEFTAGNFYSVAASTIKENEKFYPKMAIYTKSAPTWAVYPDGVPRFDDLPPQFKKA